MAKRETREGFGNQVLPRGEGMNFNALPKEPRKCRYPECSVVFQPQQPNQLYHRKECQIAHSNRKKLAREAAERKARKA